MKTDTMSSFAVSWVNNLSTGGEGRGGEEGGGGRRSFRDEVGIASSLGRTPPLPHLLLGQRRKKRREVRGDGN